MNKQIAQKNEDSKNTIAILQEHSLILEALSTLFHNERENCF